MHHAFIIDGNIIDRDSIDVYSHLMYIVGLEGEGRFLRKWQQN